MASHLRFVLVIKLPSGSNKLASQLFMRKFPLAERQAERKAGKYYVPIVPTQQLIPLILQEVGATRTASEFIPSRDGCSVPIQKPVYKIQTEFGTLWPFVVFEKSGMLFCSLPLMENVHDYEKLTSSPLINIPSVSHAFCLLSAVAEFLTSTGQDSSKISELPAFINEAAPFGSVRDTNCHNIIARLSNKPCIIPKAHKVPAWRASSFKGKPSLSLCLTEEIKASQCAQETWKDTQEVYGAITCKADFEGGGVDVNVSIVHQGDGLNIPLDSLLVHPCVQRADWKELEESGYDTRMAPRRLRFSPPAENFPLCHYTVKQLQELPIFGVYHMKSENTKATVTVQLKLSDQVKNNFEYCELRIPFLTRNSISHLEGTPTQGSVSLTANKRVLVWNIGQKFTSKDQQVLLSATVTFSGSDQGLPAPSVEDAFCRGSNSYAQLYFKIQDFTHSGCQIDAKSIQVTPTTKFKLNLSREYLASDYKIWNSKGKGLTTNVV